MKKLTDEPSCISMVRHEKHIARGMLRKVNTDSVEDANTDDRAEEDITDITSRLSSGSEIILKKRGSRATVFTL